jgi:hypothetical protein
LISRRTRNEFREALSGWGTLRTIEIAFDNEGFVPDPSHAPSVGGQRRSFIEQYYHGIDFADPRQVRRLDFPLGSGSPALCVDRDGVGSAVGGGRGRPHCGGMKDNCPMPGCRLERITRESPDLLHVAARGTRPGDRCPDCGRTSRAVHSRYRRRPADLPSLGRMVRVGLRVRRFYCRNGGCSRRTFAERLPELVAPHARRTRRLAEAQSRVGVGAALGGEGGARLLRRLSMPASANTVLRLVRQRPLPDRDAPRVVGVDDWAMRKGRTYGTIVVDLERRRVGWTCSRTARPRRWRTGSGEGRASRSSPATARRSTPAASAWARWVPSRSPIGGTCSSTCASEALERWLAGAPARLGRIPSGPGAPDDARPGPRTEPFARTRAETAARIGRRERRVTLREEVKRRHAGGEKLQAIARAMGLAVGTVRKYAYAESFPVPETQPLRPSILDPHLARLRARLAEGCENALVLGRELRADGFPGTAKQVHRWLAQHRTAPARTTPHKWRTESPAASPAPGRPPPLPSPKRLAWLLVQPSSALSVSDAAVAARALSS